MTVQVAKLQNKQLLMTEDNSLRVRMTNHTIAFFIKATRQMFSFNTYETENYSFNQPQLMGLIMQIYFMIDFRSSATNSD